MPKGKERLTSHRMMELLADKMNNLGDSLGDITKNGNMAEVLEQQGNQEMANTLRNAEQDAAAEIQRLMEAIATGKLKVSVTYEDGVQTLVKGREAELLRHKWASGLDYLPHVPFFTHFSPLLLHCYLGNYSKFMSHIEALKPEALSRELKKRETLLQVSPIFHPIIGSKALAEGTPVLPETVKVHGKPGMMHIKILKKLLDLGVEVNVHDFAGYTPLHYCLSSQGNIATLEMAKMLIEAGADVNALNRLGCTPLMEPIIAYKLEYISLLVEHGADPFIKDVEGTTPYDVGGQIPAVANLLKIADKKVISKQRTAAKEEQDFKKCAVCKKVCKLKCTGCFLEWYCNAKCQTEDWENHKGVCKLRKAEYIKVQLQESRANSSLNFSTKETIVSGPRNNSMHSVVKIQVPLSGSDDVMMVYNQDRTIFGTLAMNTDIGTRLSSTIRSHGFQGLKGFFYAMKKKGDPKGNLFINPNLLPPETW